MDRNCRRAYRLRAPNTQPVQISKRQTNGRRGPRLTMASRKKIWREGIQETVLGDWSRRRSFW